MRPVNPPRIKDKKEKINPSVQNKIRAKLKDRHGLSDSQIDGLITGDNDREDIVARMVTLGRTFTRRTDV